jgi:hypothetical protein
MDDFLASKAADTLNSVLDILIGQRASLSPDTVSALAKAVNDNGPAIYRAARGGFGENMPGRINDLLRGFWTLRDSLPPDAVTAMDAGRGAPERTLTTVPEVQRQPLLDKLVAFVDFRTFDDPAGAAAELDALVASHADRLSPNERSAWQQLRDARGRDGDHAAYLRGVAQLLGGYPPVARLIEKHRLWDPGDRLRSLTPGVPGAPGGAGSPFGRPPAPFRDIVQPGAEEGGLEVARPEDVAAADRGAVAGAAGAGGSATDEVTRFANVHFPGKVLMEQEAVPLIVHVAQVYQEGARASEEQSKVSLKLSPLSVIVRPEGFDVKWSIGGDGNRDQPHVRRVQVVKDRDCEPLVFFLTPESAGQKRICVDLEQFERRIATITFTTEVVAEAAAMEGIGDVKVDPAAVASPIRGEQALPPDLELRVLVSADRRTLEYMLHSPGSKDYDHAPMGKAELRDDPLTYLQPIFLKLSDLAKQSVTTRSDPDTRAAQRALTGIGVELYNEIFSPELKEQYGRILRKQYAGKSFLITSEEPWIPWELIAPSDSIDNEDYDDPPLCQTFRLTRWITDRPAPDQLRMTVGAWVAPPDNLAAAQDESTYFEDLHRKQWQVSLNGPLVSIDDVLTAMEGGLTNLYHFACHGNFNADTANESKLKLGSEFLTPRDIGPLKNKLKKSQPLIFLNACHGGRVGIGLTQLGGWAETFLNCQASAFIGALWEVNDALAAKFCRAFYDRLWGVNECAGQDPLPLGEAFHRARLLIRDADPANPTWLAYVLYGDPDGQIVLGNE